MAVLAAGRAAVGRSFCRGGIVLAVAVVAAVQIFVSDPGAAVAGVFVEQAELLGHGAGFGGGGGIGDHAVALSADGNTALVGAPNGNQSEPSYTLIFTRSGSVWSPPTSLVGEIGGGEQRVPGGAGVALSAAGGTALVGGGDPVFAFTREGATWRSTPIESPRETACPGRFGEAVAMSEDGSTAIVGDYFGCPEDFDGSAWIYARSGNTWTLQAGPLHGEEKINPFGNEDDFASTVALSGDGNTAIVGADSEDGGIGAAWVYKRSGSTWSQDGPKLEPPYVRPGSHFGRSVALSGDGSRAVIGEYGDEQNTGSGAWIFDRGPSGWRAQTRLSSGENVSVNGSFGWTVALSRSGNTALIGGPETGPGTSEPGEAWAFRCAATEWSREPIAPPVSTTGGHFGYSVALAGDGATALVGANGAVPTVRAHGELEPEGAAFVFTGPPDSGGLCAGTPPAAKPPGTPGTPVVESFRETHQVWLEGRALASLARSRTRAPVGTTFEFSLSEPARVRFNFAQLATGHIVRGRCVGSGSRGHRGRRCHLALGRGTLTLSATAGPSRLRFQGRLSKRDRLPSGSYALALTAEAAHKKSAPLYLSFRILA